MMLNATHRELLQAICAGEDGGVLAADLGHTVFGNISSARARSAAAAQNAWTLIREKLVERRLRKRGVYAYFITDAGKAIAEVRRGG